MTQRLTLLLTFVIALAAPTLYAHEVRPGYLEIRELGAERYAFVWKVPASGEYKLGLHLVLPDGCDAAPQTGSFAGGAFLERWLGTCKGGLTGKRIDVEGLSATLTEVIARVERLDGTTQTARLTPDQPWFELTSQPGAFDVVKTYLVLGIQHILSGVDHLLFVLGLLFLVGSWRRLIATVTAFTLAHSITLAAATLGLVRVAQAPVEATIALSVMFVAAEILHSAQGRPGLAARAPWVVAFVFGLLHGLGFAGALRQIGLPPTDIPLALLLFNVGVEVGQLAFIAAVAAILTLVTRVLSLARRTTEHGPWHAETVIRTPIAYLVGGTAAFWVVQRVVAFWP